MENNRFEDSFRNAFEGAEILPSEGVWTNVELSLEKKLGGKMKRNLLLFQILAAASVVFACGIGALYYLDTRPVNPSGIPKEALSKHDGLILTQKERDGAKEEQQGALNKGVSSNKSAYLKSPETHPAKDDSDSRLITQKASDDNQTLTIADNTKASEFSNELKPLRTYQIEKRGLSSLVRNATPVLVLPRPEKQAEPDAFMVMMARLKDEEDKYQDENKSSENMWASLGFGAGNYKPNMQAQNSNSSVTGESYSAGLHVAGKISKRIVLQGGVSYLSQNADFTSTTPVQGMATLAEYKANSYDFANSNNVGIGRTPYTVNSSMQFVSIPFQAGYLIIDRAFGFQLNGGIATDLFLNNTLSAENDSHQKVSQAAGKDSPYRTVNFSGLLGTEVSYRLAEHYRISLNPGLRYSLNSIYKEEIAVTITPVTFDVSLRFRYIFK